LKSNESKESVLGTQDTKRFLKETPNGSVEFDASGIKEVYARPDVIRKQKEYIASRLGVVMESADIQRLNEELVEDVSVPWAKGDEKTALENVRNKVGDFFSKYDKEEGKHIPMNAKARARAEMKKIRMAKEELKNDPDNTELQARVQKAIDLEAAIIQQTIPNLPTYVPFWDKVLNTTDIGIEVIQRGEPLRYQYPFDIKIAFQVNPNGTLEAVQYVPSRTTVTPRMAATEKKELRFEDWLNDEAGTFATLVGRLQDDLNYFFDWQLESQMQATLPNASLYSSHATHEITTDLDGNTITKCTPNAMIKLSGMLNHYYTDNALITEAKLRGNLPSHSVAPGSYWMGLRAIQDLQTAGTMYWSPAKSDELLTEGINGRFGIQGTPIVLNNLWDDDRVRVFGAKGSVGVLVNITAGGSSSAVKNEMVGVEGEPFSVMKVWGWKYYAILIGGHFHQARMVIART